MPERPNILLITTDQQRFDTIAALGNHQIYTPHLNWLADTGIAYTRCYTDCPVCMPARATMMTGLPGYAHGLVGNDTTCLPMRDHPTFASLLTQAGYQTRAEGKLHFHPMRALYGLEHADLPMDYFNEMRRLGRASTRAHGVGENEMEPALNTLPEQDTLTHWTVRRSMEFLDSRDPTRPFFLWTSFAKPHPPFDPCLPYWELYRDAPLEPPAVGDWAQDPARAPLGFYKPTFYLNNFWRFSPEQQRSAKRAYYACLTQIDYNLGLLFARMRELELLQNTWIIFTSDHGEMLGDHRMGAKSVFFEGAAHIPFLIRPPAAFGQDGPPQRCGKLATLADLAPTILHLAGVRAPSQMRGRDLLTYLDEGNEQDFFGDCEHTYFAVISGRYKYTWTRLGGGELLFDLQDDPRELHDLARLGGGELVRMRGKLAAWMQAHCPACVRDGQLLAGPGIAGPQDVPRFPGLNTTLLPRDSYH